MIRVLCGHLGLALLLAACGGGGGSDISTGMDTVSSADVPVVDVEMDIGIADSNGLSDAPVADQMTEHDVDGTDGLDAFHEDSMDGLAADAFDGLSTDVMADLAGDASADGSDCRNRELGASCSVGACECASGKCYVLGAFGGVCSECETDDDCTEATGFGCNLPNPLVGVPATCSATGGTGENCEDETACADGLFCAVIFEIPGIFSSSSCGECESDMDCEPGKLCTPEYDLGRFGGAHSCSDPGTIPNNEGCDLRGDGSECISGNCAPAFMQGIPVLGVCSPCNEDADCGGSTCVFPEVTLDGAALVLVPGECV